MAHLEYIVLGWMLGYTFGPLLFHFAERALERRRNRAWRKASGYIA